MAAGTQYRMLTSVGSSEGWSYETGAIVSAGDHYSEDVVLDATLRGWVEAGTAEPVAPAPVEVTDAAPVERTSEPKAEREPVTPKVAAAGKRASSARKTTTKKRK